MSEAKIRISAEDKTRAAFESAKGNLVALRTKAVAVSGAIAGLGLTVFAAGIATSVGRAIDEFDRLGKAAQSVGFQSAQALAEFQYAAKLSGLEAKGFEQAVGKLAEKMADAAGGNKLAAATFTALGVQLKDAQGNLRSTETVITELARKFAEFKDGPEKTALAMDLFGKSGRDLIPLLNGGAEGVDKLRGEFRQLRGTLDDRTIKASEEFNDNLSKLREAASWVGDELATQMLPGLVKITNAMVEAAKQGSWLRTVWAGLAEAGKAIAGVDDSKSKKAQLEMLEESLRIGGDSPDGKLAKRIAQLRREVYNTPEMQRAAEDFRRSELTAPPAPKRAAPVVRQPDGGGGGGGSSDVAAARARELEQQKRLLAELSGVQASYMEDLTRLQAMRVQQNMTDERYVELVTELISQQPGVRAFFKAKEDAQRAAAEETERARKANEEYLRTLAQQVQASQESVEVAQLELETMGMSRAEIAELTLAKLEYRRVTLMVHEGTLEEIAAIEAQIEAQRRLIGIYRDGEVKQATRNAAEDAKRSWEQVAQSMTDSLMRGGKSAAQYLKDLFRTLVLRPILAPVGQGISGVIGSMMGGPAAAATGGGGGSGLLGTVGNALGFTAAGSALSAGLAGAGTALAGGATFGTVGAIGGSAAAIGTGATGLAGAVGSVAAGAQAAMAAMGPVGWAVLAIAAIFALSKKFKGETRVGATYRNGEFAHGPSGGQIGGAQEAVTATMSGINAALAGLGSDARLTEFVSALEQSKKGKGFAYAGGTLSTGATFGQFDETIGRQNRRGSKSAEQAVQEFGEELKQATLQALQAADVPGILGDYLRSLGDVDKLTGGALDAAVNRINKALAEKQALQARWDDMVLSDAEKLLRFRQAELDAVDESNRLMLLRVHALEDEIGAQAKAKAALQEFTGLALNIRGYVDRLNATPAGLLAPETQLANAKAQFAIQLAQAKAGDRNALQNITGYADQLLNAQTAFSASGGGTMQTIAYVKDALSQLAGSLTSEEYIAQAVGDGANLVNATLEELMARADANAQKLYDAFLGEKQAKEAQIAPAATAAAAAAAAAAAPSAAEAAAAAQHEWVEQYGNIFAGGPLPPGFSFDGTMGAPGYAAGGFHPGGWRWVGERGLELAYTGPERIYSNQQSRSMLSTAALEAKIEQLTGTVERLVVINAEAARREHDLQEQIRRNTAESSEATRRLASARERPVLA